MALIARTCGGTEYKTTCITHPDEEGQHTLGRCGLRECERREESRFSSTSRYFHEAEH